MANLHETDGDHDDGAMLELGPVEREAGEDDALELSSVTGRDLAVGCGGVLALLVGLAALLVGVMLVWQASDHQQMSEDFRARGERVEVVVVDRDVTTHTTGSMRGTGGGSARDYWLAVRPAPAPDAEGTPEAGSGEEAAGRLAVSRAEHDAARRGDRLTVWRLGERYELERIIENPLGFGAGRIVLGAGVMLALGGIVAVGLVVRRVRAAT